MKIIRVYNYCTLCFKNTISHGKNQLIFNRERITLVTSRTEKLNRICYRYITRTWRYMKRRSTKNKPWGWWRGRQCSPCRDHSRASQSWRWSCRSGLAPSARHASARRCGSSSPSPSWSPPQSRCSNFLCTECKYWEIMLLGTLRYRCPSSQYLCEYFEDFSLT